MKKAFTLIEVMVVLSILAIIAILAYNFFGGTMREAKVKQAITQMQRSLAILDTAIGKMQLEGASIDVTWSSGAQLETGLVGGGYLSTVPPIPEFGSGHEDFEYYCTGMEDMGGPSATEDCQIYTNTIVKEVCEGLNEAWGLPKAVWDYAGNGNSITGADGAPGVCTDWGTGVNSNDYFIFYRIDPR